MDYLHEEREKERQLLENAKLKFGKEPMSKIEFAAYYNSLDSNYTVDEKTIRNKLRKIYEKYESYVKENPFSGKKIPVNIQKMLLVYLRSNRLDKRKDSNDVCSIEIDDKILKEMIDKHLDKKDILFLKETPAYVYAEMESEVNTLLKKWMNNTLYYLINLEPHIKMALIHDFARALEYSTNVLEGYRINSSVDKLIFSDTCSDEIKSRLYEIIEKMKTIEEILEVCMLMRASGIEEDFIIKKWNKVTSIDLYMLKNHYNGIDLSEEQDKECFKDVIELLDENIRYTRIIERVKNVLDFNKSEDILVYLLIKVVVEDLVLSYSMKEDGYKKVLSLLKMAHSNNADYMMEPLRKLLDNSKLNKN